MGGQPSLLSVKPFFHRCSRRGHRQEHVAPFKRTKVMYTYRFEQYVPRLLIGSNDEEVAARLGISAETVALIVENPRDLKPGEREALDRLFVELPVLKDVHDVRVRFKEICDTAPDRATAAEEQLAELRAWTESLGLNFSKLWTPHENWKEGILNCFGERYASAAVEGINNKGRGITKWGYGVKSFDTLWNRLILDLNRASEPVGRTIGELRDIVSGLKAVPAIDARALYFKS